MRIRLLVRAQAAMINCVSARNKSAIVISLTAFITAFLQTLRFSAKAILPYFSEGGRGGSPPLSYLFES